jgi:hypothetical protein
MIDNGFQFNWRGMTREPQRPYAQPQDGTAQARAAYIASQAANMQGYRPLPDMGGYQPTIGGRNVNPDSNPMTQPEIAMMQGEQTMRSLMDRLEANEQRIEELKQEYLSLQQEQETSTEELERNIAANRAGVGDSSQYNVWRSRVEARETQNKAREADSEATLRQANTKLNNALRDLSYARGDKETAVAKQIYEDALAEYNEKARKAGLPEKSPSEFADGKTVTMFDTKDFIRQHRNSKGQWDSEENRQKAYGMAKSLGDEGVQLLDEIYGQTTTGNAAKKQAEYDSKVQAEVDKIDLRYVGDGDTVNIEIDGQPVPAKVQVKADGSYVAVVNGKNYKLRK